MPIVDLLEEQTVVLYTWEQRPQRCRFIVAAEPPSFQRLRFRFTGTREKNYRKEQQFRVELVRLLGNCPIFNARERLLVRRAIKEKLEQCLGIPVRISSGVIQLGETNQCE